MRSATKWPLRLVPESMLDSASGVITASPATWTIPVGTVLAPRSRVGVRIVMSSPLGLERADGMGAGNLVAVLAAVAAHELDDLLCGIAAFIDLGLVRRRRPVGREIIEHHVFGAR